MKTLIKFKKFIDKLNLENGRNYKLEILEEYKFDEDIKYYLNYIYNPYITTGISDKKYNQILNQFQLLTTNPNKSEDNYLTSFKDVLEYLKIHNTGALTDLQVIANFYNYNLNYFLNKNSIFSVNVGIRLEELFKGIITKNLILGINSLSINKVMPNLIPCFNVQLAEKYFEKPDAIEGKEFALTTKIDGGRIIALKKNGIAKFYTRQGQEYTGLIDLQREMEENFPDNVCLDGEITLLHKGNLNSKEQYKQTMKITRADGEKHNVKMLVFDCMSAEEFEGQTCNLSYLKRREKLDKLLNSYSSKYFEELPILYEGKEKNKINELLTEAIDKGEEGLMINIVNAPYYFKRTDSLLKVKKMKDIDLTIIGYEEGTNTNKGKLGAFIVDYNGDKVKVGSGFTKELREEIWKNPKDYIGLTISVQYFEETENANGGKSLRFPVFLDFRYDK